MTTKEYLNQISRLNRMINNKLAEISQLRELSCSISAVSTEERVRSTPNVDRIGNTYAKIDEMEKNLDKIIDDFTEKKQKIISQIDSMENENVYNVLFPITSKRNRLKRFPWRWITHIDRQFGFMEKHCVNLKKNLVMNICKKIKDVMECHI